MSQHLPGLSRQLLRTEVGFKDNVKKWAASVCKGWWDAWGSAFPAGRRTFSPWAHYFLKCKGHFYFFHQKDMEKAEPFSQMLLAWILLANTTRSICWVNPVSGWSSAWGNKTLQKSLKKKHRKKYNFLLFCGHPELQTWNTNSWVWSCLWAIDYWRLMLPHTSFMPL